MTAETEKALVPKPQLTLAPHSLGYFLPRNLEELGRMARMICMSKMVPKSLIGQDWEETEAKVSVAIQMGMEVGLSPLMAVQNIAVINAMPSIWGDAALGLVMASGLMVDNYPKEFHTGEEMTDEWTAHCIVKRKGDTDETERIFSWKDAKRAALSGKQGPWQQYPKRMMQMRARSWALKDKFSDILKGLHHAEETMDIIDMGEIAPGVYQKPEGPKTAKDILKEKAGAINVTMGIIDPGQMKDSPPSECKVEPSGNTGELPPAEDTQPGNGEPQREYDPGDSTPLQPEAEHEKPHYVIEPKATQAQLNKLNVTAAAKGFTHEQVLFEAHEKYHVNSTKELTKAQASELIEVFSALPSANVKQE